MKNIVIFLIIFLLLMAGCGGNRKLGNQNDALITIDVTKSYPKKELVLQDFMDVEYVALETADEFLCQGEVLAIGKEIILVRNSISDGTIFVFDRKGKGLRKINRMGQGREEYTRSAYASNMVTLDEENSEIFMEDRSKGILVYDLHGNFLRSFPKGEGVNYSSLKKFDREYLICRETTVPVDEKSTESQSFAIISKKDGSMVKDIRIRFSQGINQWVAATVNNEMQFNVDLSSLFNSIISFHDSWILTELSSDTVYRLLPDYSMTPFMTRVPSIHSMNREIFLLPVILTDRYYFMEALTKVSDGRSLFPKTVLAYDTQEKVLFNYSVLNDDYATNKTIEFSSFSTTNVIASRRDYSTNEIVFRQKIEAHELVEANEKGELKGRLKEIAAELNEESNPVIMLVKHKK
jgi:hypothetical protein